MNNRIWPYIHTDQKLKEVAVHILYVNGKREEARLLETILEKLTEREDIIKQIEKKGIYVY
jgi:hypothetical protein